MRRRKIRRRRRKKKKKKNMLMHFNGNHIRSPSNYQRVGPNNPESAPESTYIHTFLFPVQLYLFI